MQNHAASGFHEASWPLACSGLRKLSKGSGAQFWFEMLNKESQGLVPRCVGRVTVLIEISGCSRGFAADQALTLMPRLEMGHASQHVA